MNDCTTRDKSAPPPQRKRLIDRRIAREIFLLDIVEASGTYGDYTISDDPAYGVGRHKALPRYCSDMAAAMRVAHWMRESIDPLHVIAYGDTRQRVNRNGASLSLSAERGDDWLCQWRRDGATYSGADASPASNSLMHVIAFGDTRHVAIRTAICEAALAACGGVA